MYGNRCYYLGMRAAGFVLVGGESSRMGRDKALLAWGSHVLVEEVAATVQNVAGTAALVGPPERYRALKYACIPDVRRGLGPLAGIEAALESGRGELNLIVACDMPGLSEATLRRLIDSARDSGALCTAIRDSAGKVHPLCAVYRSECMAAVRRALDARRLRALDLLADLNAAILENDAPLANVNTPQEWAQWRRHAG